MPGRGVLLIGFRAHTPELFQGIPWSTERVTGVTLANAAKNRINVSLLDPWYDVDTMEDLLRLKRDLEASQDAPACRQTFRMISRLQIDNQKKV